MTRHTLVLCIALIEPMPAVLSAAQQSGPSVPAASVPPLTDFLGVYDYRRTAVAIVPRGDFLVAVIDEALYPLRHASGDEFRNLSDTAVKFERNELEADPLTDIRNTARIAAVSCAAGCYQRQTSIERLPVIDVSKPAS